MSISLAEANRRKVFAKAAVKHGAYKSPEYIAWLSMRQRCANPKHPCYALYGGRGITVCEQWERFEQFIADMGKRPSPDHELERKNNDDGYSKINCVWATRKEQMRNTRRTILVELHGRTQCLKDWCSELGVSYTLALGRIRRRWTPEAAILHPVNSQYRHKGL